MKISPSLRKKSIVLFGQKIKIYAQNNSHVRHSQRRFAKRITMFLTTKTKLIAIAIALSGMIFLMLVTPFAIVSSVGIFSQNFVRSLFSLAEFFTAIFFLNEYHRNKIIIRKEEMAGQKSEKMIRDIAGKFKSSSIGMKGIILAGGTATRLFPLTITTSKQLLPVYDYQMIFYPLNTLIKAGIRDIFIIVAPDNSGQFLNLLGSAFKEFGVNLYFEVQKAPRGLADAFIMAENFISDDNVTLILGDNIFEDNVSEAIAGFKSGGHIFAKKVPDPERLGVVKFDENKKAVQIVEKPKTWISDYAITGLYIFDKSVVNVAKNLKPSERGEIEITDVNNVYLKESKLKISILDGAWMDAGTFDSLLEAGNIAKEKKISENFHPIVKEAVVKFNQELKYRLKKNLEAHNLYLREEQMEK